jgi:hypothetical protein
MDDAPQVIMFSCNQESYKARVPYQLWKERNNSTRLLRARGLWPTTQHSEVRRLGSRTPSLLSLVNRGSISIVSTEILFGERQRSWRRRRSRSSLGMGHLPWRSWPRPCSDAAASPSPSPSSTHQRKTPCWRPRPAPPSRSTSSAAPHPAGVVLRRQGLLPLPPSHAHPPLAGPRRRCRRGRYVLR